MKLLCPICESKLREIKRVQVDLPFVDGQLEEIQDLNKYILSHVSRVGLICQQCGYSVNDLDKYFQDLEKLKGVTNWMFREVSYSSFDFGSKLEDIPDDGLGFLIKVLNITINDNVFSLLIETHKLKKLNTFSELCQKAMLKSEEQFADFLARQLVLEKNYGLVTEALYVVNKTRGFLLPSAIKYLKPKEVLAFMNDFVVSYDQWFSTVRTCCKLNLTDNLRPILDFVSTRPSVFTEVATEYDSVECLSIMALEFGILVQPTIIDVAYSNNSVKCTKLIVKEDLINLEKLSFAQLVKIAELLRDFYEISDQDLKNSLISLIRPVNREKVGSKLRDL